MNSLKGPFNRRVLIYLLNLFVRINNFYILTYTYKYNNLHVSGFLGG